MPTRRSPEWPTSSSTSTAALATELRDDEGARAALQKVPSLIQRTLEDAFASVEALDRYAGAPHVLVVGRGYNYSTAMEIALKLRELTATVAEGFSAADLMHGPIAAIAPGTPALLIAAHGKALSSVLEASDALRKRGAQPILIAPRPTANLPLPSTVPEWLSPMIAVAPGQVLALRRAVVGGRAIDQPVGLTKVTETC
jgi:glucosamine--fructose-6-phosphate aminotransferase (isomerizing)